MKGQVAASAVALASLAREGWRGARRPRLHRGGRRGGRRRLRPRLARARASRRVPRRLRDQRGRRRPRRDRGPRALPLRDRREDERAVPAARPRPQRARVDAGHRRQRARQGGAAGRAARRATRPTPRARRPRPRRSSRRSGTASRRRPTRRSRSRARSRRSRASWSSRCSGRRSRRRWPSASSRRNVIPSVCEITVDCRILPGVDPDGRARRGARVPRRRATTSSSRSSAAAARARRSTGRCGTRSRRSSRELEPGARVAPICTAGFTDSHWMRVAFGTVAYGFYPSRFDPETAARLIHSADERVPVDDLELGVRLPALHGARRLRLGSADAGAARGGGRVRGARGLPRRGGVLGRDGRRRRPLPRLRAVGGAPPRRRAPAPPEPCPLPLLACRIRPASAGASRATSRRLPRSASGSGAWDDDGYAAAIEAVRAAIARGDVYQVNLVQHLSAPFAGDAGGLAAALAPLRPLRAAAARRRRLGDRLGLARALPRAARAAAADDADQGHAAGGRGRRRREGRGRARDDRRPRAQRPRARLRAGLDPLAAS